MKIEILFEDPVLVVVNKPPGFPVHETVDKSRPHVQGLLEKQLDKKLVLFHRLDVDTTGVLAFGKDPSINAAMTEAFRSRQTDKTYWAVVDGVWPENGDVVRTFIRKTTGGKWINGGKGKGAHSAETHFKVLASNGDKTWLEVHPITGRTHQIRLHCQYRNHSILGDRYYGKVDRHGVPLALHAKSLKFKHPISGKDILVEAPAPDYWKDYWLKGLKT